MNDAIFSVSTKINLNFTCELYTEATLHIITVICGILYCGKIFYNIKQIKYTITHTNIGIQYTNQKTKQPQQERKTLKLDFVSRNYSVKEKRLN